MSVQRLLCATALSVCIALTSFAGAGTGLANASGPVSSIATTTETPTPQPTPGVKLNHHDQKKLDKYLKKHPEIAVPNAGAH